MRNAPRLLPHLPFAVADVHPTPDRGRLLGVASLELTVANGDLVTIRGWKILDSTTGRHVCPPAEKVLVEGQDGEVERRYSPIVTYPKAWRATIQAAILEAFERRQSIEGGR